MTPKCLLVGHTAPILCLSTASIIQDNNYIVSSSEAGEMCTWDLVDGKCRETVKLPQVHTNMQVRHYYFHIFLWYESFYNRFTPFYYTMFGCLFFFKLFKDITI